eukprot:4069292-Prymnesium_polylepis.1
MAVVRVYRLRLNIDPWLDLGRAGTAIYNRAGVLARASLVRLSFVLTPCLAGARYGPVLTVYGMATMVKKGAPQATFLRRIKGRKSAQSERGYGVQLSIVSRRARRLEEKAKEESGVG